ncbi:MAG: nucleotide exchange factor GrpE [Syntrophaceae bacterium]|nr:nucleotide exchange factor GrpE [Syntrophaceae bacterium]HOC60596.1 nucleotide exchange factor GrpE [Smithellaceae bacterium]HQM44538.1 nucleotide exchange factor GrpE [Smithellaceae bacterium]
MKTKKEHVERKIKVHESEALEENKETAVLEQDEVAALKETIEQKEKEAKDHYDRYMRAAAELDNYKKRAAKEKADVIKYGKEDIIKDILPFLDSLDRALEHKDANDAQAFRNGIALIQDQLLCCLKKHGVERIECAGTDFDPNFHEALMQMDSSDHDDNQIVSEVEKGYLLNGRLIRPSRVCVCKKTKHENQCEITEANGQ